MIAVTQVEVRGPTGHVLFRLDVDGRRLGLARSVLSGRYDLAGAQPHRILDYGAGEGAFACWCFVRWPSAWLDCYEPEPEQAELLARNLPPGAAILTVDQLDQVEHGTYDIVRLATPWTDDMADPLRGRLLTIHDYLERP